MLHYNSLIAVAVGGAVGSAARRVALEIVTGDVESIGADAAAQRALLATLAINVLGSFLLGVLLARQQSMTANQFLAIGTGFAGGFTTFSTFAVAVAERLDGGQLLATMANGLGTAGATLLAAGLGYRLGVVTR